MYSQKGHAMTDPRLLGNRYELGDVLGRGGMAEVRYGRDLRLGRVVAIKMLRVDYAADATFQERFRREAQSAASLNHRNVVAVYDTGEDYVDGNLVPYIVMEYVEGRTLRDLLRERARFTSERSIEVAAGILDALEYSHKAGIVHRDIKPGNVMINGAGEVKVMDFGIARSLAETGAALTQTAAVVGTAQYISPEQARGESADARSDLYALGCVLYELLTGRPPFVGDSLVSVAVSHVRELATPPSALDPSIPRDLDSIVLKSLAKDRTERYQSAYEMRADLERCAAGMPISADATAHTQFIGGGGYGETAFDEPVQTSYGDVVDDYDDDDGKRGMRWGPLVAAALAILGVAALIGYLAFSGDGGGSDPVRVPDLLNGSQADAEAWATTNDVELTVETREVNDEADEGNVVQQDPAPNTTIDPETEGVTVWIGVGPEDVTVPANLVGMPQADAEEAIRAADLTVGDVSLDEDSDEEAGTVLSTDPASGTSVQPGIPVNLVVASAPDEVRVPNLATLDEEGAREELEAVDLVLGTVRTEENAAPEGTVFQQDPASGESAEAGDRVDIWISEGEPEPELLPVPNVVEDSQGNRYNEEQARGLLEPDFDVDVTDPQPTCDVEAGRVVGQNPAAGTELEPGSTVTITLAEEPPQGCDDGNGG
jgi:beta-lactam-binding protein with PASTA domain/predicted Ser/Thr protein kinase